MRHFSSEDVMSRLEQPRGRRLRRRSEVQRFWLVLRLQCRRVVQSRDERLKSHMAFSDSSLNPKP